MTSLQLSETKWREMRGSYFICFGFQKTFYTTDVFSTRSCLSIWLEITVLTDLSLLW